MKLLIGGKIRNIYMRKDGSAYYKSGGQQVDITHMFKKNGGGLKKQYIGGVEGNLAKVERKKRLQRNYSLVLGGANNELTFPKIQIVSSNIVPDNNIITGDTKAEFNELCRLAMVGAYSVYNERITSNAEDDKIHIEKIKTSAEYIAQDGITSNAPDNITVTRGYILNKVLGSFWDSNVYDRELENPNQFDNAKSAYSNTVPAEEHILSNVNILCNLGGTPKFVNKADFETVVNNINSLRITTETLNVPLDHTSEIVRNIKNIYGILFLQEKIGIRTQ